MSCERWGPWRRFHGKLDSDPTARPARLCPRRNRGASNLDLISARGRGGSSADRAVDKEVREMGGKVGYFLIGLGVAGALRLQLAGHACRSTGGSAGIHGSRQGLRRAANGVRLAHIFCIALT